MLTAAVTLPCAHCNREELSALQQYAKKSEDAFWEYRVPVRYRCSRCSTWFDKVEDYAPSFVSSACGIVGAVLAKDGHFTASGMVAAAGVSSAMFGHCVSKDTCYRRVPLPQGSVSVIQRSMEAAAVAEKGSKYRAHGTFVHHLSGLEVDDMIKDALLVWAPHAIAGYAKEMSGYSRTLLRGHFQCNPDPVPIDTHSGNPDCDGVMVGTHLEGNEYGEEIRVVADVIEPAKPRTLAVQIGPDIQPTEVMETTVGNLEAGLRKRVDPLPFIANSKMKEKIGKTTKAIIDVVFSKENVNKWREANPDFSEMHSKKWSSQRFSDAWDETLAEVEPVVEQEFQIKLNEALPAKDKAPRPIIQSGDRGQVLMMLPVKCFEDLMFEFFEDASIKHVAKHAAMSRVSKHLRQKVACHLIEGDGSAWDSCCNPTIRELTENEIVKHIIDILCFDSQVPRTWMDAMLRDMKKLRIRGKAKIRDFCVGKVKANIDAIRQSGHRGTSAFNYLVNLVCWLCVISDEPEKLILKDKKGKLASWYVSPRDSKWYTLKYAFEGDDSALSTTENLQDHQNAIELAWKEMGFRMKLVYVKDKMTFTGFDFQVDEKGPTGIFIPEIARNIASSSWSCSSLLKTDPTKVHEVGAAAMLARAENFKDYGPLSYYFATLGLAHSRRNGDSSIGEQEAVNLGIQPCDSVMTALHALRDDAEYPSEVVRGFVTTIVGELSHEETLRLLSFEVDDPLDTTAALQHLPKNLWGVAGLSLPRRSPPGLV